MSERRLFRVLDTRTHQEPTPEELEQIALTEPWAKDLIYCDIEGFWLDEYGNLALTDDTGRIVYCPVDRFVVQLTAWSTDRC